MLRGSRTFRSIAAPNANVAIRRNPSTSSTPNGHTVTRHRWCFSQLSGGLVSLDHDQSPFAKCMKELIHVLLQTIRGIGHRGPNLCDQL